MSTNRLMQRNIPQAPAATTCPAKPTKRYQRLLPCSQTLNTHSKFNISTKLPHRPTNGRGVRISLFCLRDEMTSSSLHPSNYLRVLVFNRHPDPYIHWQSRVVLSCRTPNFNLKKLLFYYTNLFVPGEG
jgi:hypothetical protein